MRWRAEHCCFQSTRREELCQTWVADSVWLDHGFFVRSGSRILRMLLEKTRIGCGILSAGDLYVLRFG